MQFAGLLGLAVSVLLMSCAAQVEGESMMKIEVSKTAFDLGESIPIKVIFDNPTDAPVKREDPSRSLEVIMHATDTGSQEELSYSMGKIEVTTIEGEGDQYAISQPQVDTIEIAPDSSFSFVSDLHERLYLRPAEFDCFVSNPDIESNHVTLTVNFTRESVRLLLETVRNIEAGYSRREWAMDWLRQLQPEFELKLPLDEDSAEFKAQCETDNSPVYERFSAWWSENRDSAEIDSLLAQASAQ